VAIQEVDNARCAAAGRRACACSRRGSCSSADSIRSDRGAVGARRSPRAALLVRALGRVIDGSRIIGHFPCSGLMEGRPRLQSSVRRPAVRAAGRPHPSGLLLGQMKRPSPSRKCRDQICPKTNTLRCAFLLAPDKHSSERMPQAELIFPPVCHLGPACHLGACQNQPNAKDCCKSVRHARLSSGRLPKTNQMPKIVAQPVRQ
jgi:hypothetical protein